MSSIMSAVVPSSTGAEEELPTRELVSSSRVRRPVDSSRQLIFPVIINTQLIELWSLVRAVVYSSLECGVRATAVEYAYSNNILYALLAFSSTGKNCGIGGSR